MEVSDSRIRSLERRSSAGDPEAQAKLEREWIRLEERGVIPCQELYKDPLRHVEGVEDMESLRCPLCNGTGFRLYRESVELRAYCGDKAARKVVGWCCMRHAAGLPGEGGRCHSDYDLATWLQGLSRCWGQIVRKREQRARLLERRCRNGNTKRVGHGLIWV